MSLFPLKMKQNKRKLKKLQCSAWVGGQCGRTLLWPWVRLPLVAACPGRARQGWGCPHGEKAMAAISYLSLIKAVIRGLRGRKQQGNTGQRGTKISVFISPSGCGLLLLSFFPLPASNPLSSLSFREHSIHHAHVKRGLCGEGRCGSLEQTHARSHAASP